MYSLIIVSTAQDNHLPELIYSLWNLMHLCSKSQNTFCINFYLIVK